MSKRVTVNISLPPSLKKRIDEQIARRGFGTSSEYFRHLARLDCEAHSPFLKQASDLHAKVRAGRDSGPATPLTKADLDRIRAAARAAAAGKPSRRKSA